jgi:hypothetical protein
MGIEDTKKLKTNNLRILRITLEKGEKPDMNLTKNLTDHSYKIRKKLLNLIVNS